MDQAKPNGLTKDQILTAYDAKIVPVEIPEWKNDDGTPGIVYVRNMSARDRDAVEAEMFGGDTPNRDNMRAKVCARTICDKDGTLLFDVEEVRKLGQKSAKAIMLIFNEASKLNGLTKDALEQIQGESPGGQDEDSHSA